MLNIWNNPLKYLVFLFMLIINSQVFASQYHYFNFVNNTSESFTISEGYTECLKWWSDPTVVPAHGRAQFSINDSNDNSCAGSEKIIVLGIKSSTLFTGYASNPINFVHKLHGTVWNSKLELNLPSGTYGTYNNVSCSMNTAVSNDCGNYHEIDSTIVTLTFNPVIATNPNTITGNILNLANTNKYPKVAETTSNCTFDSNFTNVITSGGNYVLNAQVLQPFGFLIVE